MLLLSLVLILGGIHLNTRSGNNYDEFSNASMVVIVLGEGFDDACSLIVDTAFTDTGKVDFQFRLPASKESPQIAWVQIAIFVDSLDFMWKTFGNVKEWNPIDDKQAVTQNEAHEGTGFFLDFFRIVVDNDEVPERILIQLDPNSVIYENGDLTRIRSPYIGTIKYNRHLAESEDFNLQYFVDTAGPDVVERLFSAGEIDEKPLSPATLRIIGSYGSEQFYYNSSYELINIAPFHMRRCYKS